MSTSRPVVHRRALAVLAAGVVSVAPVSLTVTSAPATAAPSQSAAAAPQAVALAGTHNTRTFAGYRSADGMTVNDRVIRSDNLARLTPADKATLARRHVTSIIDFRTTAERTVQPDASVPGAAVHNFDVLGATPPTTLVDMPAAYRAFVTDANARLAFRHTLLDVENTARSGGTALIHCSAGKDRTGWASAVLLTLLGVDRATVERDYLASNAFRHAKPGSANGVDISWLRTSFDTANRTYGSFENYVNRGLGLTDADITALRKALLT